MLGLAPNASRLSVRFFMQDTFGHFAQNLMKHQEQMEIVCSPSEPWGILTLWDLLQETANRKSSKKEPPAQLIGDVTRAVLTGTLYPASLYAQVQLRLRAEKQISHNKAAIIKAYLLRNVVKEDDTHPYKEALGVKLNENTSCLPYRLGRLFAVLECLQEAAAGKKLNTTIRDRYFNSACSTPATVFPRLVALAQNHLRKLSDGSRIYYTKLVSELFSGMDESYPVRLSLQEQGVFQIGYYHQMQYMYTKKEDKNNV